jgi:signal transduction histidine kinase
MFALLRTPTFPDEETTRRARLLLLIARVMFGIAAAAMTVALTEPANDWRVTLAFYGSVFVGVCGLAALVQRGLVEIAGWVTSLFFWTLISVVTLFFGGLQGQNAGTFCVAVLLMGTLVSGRAAFGLALVSSLWCAFVGWLELEGRLPAQLGVYSVRNGWTALTVTLTFTSVLLWSALDSLQQLHRKAEAAAQARDEALRRSIQAQKMELVGTLASGLAHDFNNLLTVVGSASSALREQHGTDAESAESLADLDAATSRASLLTRQLLGFGRAQVEELSPVDLGALVRATAAMLPRLLGRRIEFVVEVAEGCVVTAAPAGIEQIVLNLAVNARDAMPEGGTFRLVVKAREEVIELEASDTGAGMDEATQARVFEPFFTTKRTGTGLGLATVRELVTRFRATIELQSAKGQGTTFRLRFPRAAP